MLGHGQVQGFGEKYGMEFRRATLDEQPDSGLIERHEREIFPLLHRRAWFAEAHDFLLYDLVTDRGAVDEHVFAYSNGVGPERSLVVYHDRFASTSGTIRDSAVYAVKSLDGSKRLVSRSLAEGLGLPREADTFVTFRDARTGLESIRSCRELWEHGLRLALEAYETHVFWEFREITDGIAGQWARLAQRLGGAGVPSLDEALLELQLEPVHRPFRQVFAGGLGPAILDGAATAEQFDALETRVAVFLQAVADATRVSGDVAPLATTIRARTEAVLSGARTGLPSRTDRAALLGWLLLARTGELAPGADVGATSRAWFDELRLAGAFAAGLREGGLDEVEASAGAELVGVLLALPRTSGLRGPARTADARLFDLWLARDVIRTAIGLNTWQGVAYVDRDGLEAVAGWALRLDGIETAGAVAAPAGDVGPKGGAGPVGGAGPEARTVPKRPDLVARLSTAAAGAGYRVDLLRSALAPAPPGRGSGRPPASSAGDRQRT
jgi:hypothetical protein